MRWKWSGGFALRTSADTKGDVQRVLRKLEATDQAQTILRLVANSPHVFRPFVLLSNSLTYLAKLPAKDREVVVLYLAHREGAPYEWEAHLGPARSAGLTEPQIDALREGRARSDVGLFDDAQVLAIDLCDHLASGGHLTDDHWHAARTAWSDEGATDFMFTVAWWGGFVPIVARSLDLQPTQD
ncbi:MAG: hypothetical protein QOD92_3270 [Acidimicrobiaceae bacterium]|jgi:4-carboxymuconolactone decarboxylase